MSYCRQMGKDRVLFVTKEDHETPSTVTLPEDPDGEPRGLILPSGEINWNCPCLGGMATGPCGIQFREAFSCFHYSKEEPKGSDCFEQFREMQMCMSQYPKLYPNDDDDKREMEPEDESGTDGSKDSVDLSTTYLSSSDKKKS